MLGDYEETWEWGARALSAFEVDLDIHYCVWAHCGNAWAYADRGRWREALDASEAALRVATRAGDAGLLSYSHLIRSLTYTAQGNLVAAVDAGEIAVELAPSAAERSWAQVQLAFAWCRSGQVERAVEVLADVVPLFRQVRMAIVEVWGTAYLGEAYWRAGRLDEAAETLRALVDRAQQLRMRFSVGSALRLLGEVTRDVEPTEDGRRQAERWFQQSIEVLSAIAAENELALAHAGYGRLVRDRDDREGARRHLSAALGIFARLGTLTEPHLVRRDLAALDNDPIS